MPTFATKRIVPFSARQMFDLVADIERYPEFLPMVERGGGLAWEKTRSAADREGYATATVPYTADQTRNAS